MTRIFSVALLGMAICFPVSGATTASVSGGGSSDPCTGKQATLVCEEANGTMCNDVGNAYESADDNQTVVQTSISWSCKTENGNNNDCSGTAKKTSTRCKAP